MFLPEDWEPRCPLYWGHGRCLCGVGELTSPSRESEEKKEKKKTGQDCSGGRSCEKLEGDGSGAEPRPCGLIEPAPLGIWDTCHFAL